MPEAPSLLRRALRWSRRLAAVLISLCAVVGAVRLIAPATPGGPAGEPPGVRRQLAFLRGALDAGAAEDAQALFPEGYFFLHVLYGLTWVELGLWPGRAGLGLRPDLTSGLTSRCGLA
ncbi:hypothetical protein AB0M50_56070, partial [Nonomuraea fuscirosea]